MSKRIEEELAEMNRLKRLELEFLFFQAKMDNTTFKKYRDALANESNTLQHIDSELQYAQVQTKYRFNMKVKDADDIFNPKSKDY